MVHILFAEQVVQFYSWKASALQTPKFQIDNVKVGELSQFQRGEIDCLKSVLLKDHHQAEMVLSCMTGIESRQYFFNWEGFASAVSLWEEYASELRGELLRSLPYWMNHQSIFEVPYNES